MPSPAVVIVFALLIVALGVLITVATRIARRGQIQDRLFRGDELADGDVGEFRTNWLVRWLYLAGYRDPQAPLLFVFSSIMLLGVGIGFAMLMLSFGTVGTLYQLLVSVPGGVGEVFIPFVLAAPWLGAIVIALVPTLVVRDARKKRVQKIEQDLPMTLDLLATLSEAGIGFDAAVDRLIETQDPERPLVQEFRSFQVDLLAGRGRIDALRRLSRRVEVTWFSIFVSALVQAEQIGAGIANVIRAQADDLRNRRRERALAFAMSIPIKLLFPLVLCFLPGIFVITIGPMFFQLFRAIEGVLRDAGLQ